MLWKFKKVTIWAKMVGKRPERVYKRQDGSLFSKIRPFVEIGVAEREHFLLYYFGVGRCVVGIAVRSRDFKPSWVITEDALKKCLSFEEFKRKKKNANHRYMEHKPE